MEKNIDKFLQAINCGVEEWEEEKRYFDVAIDLYKSASTEQREKLKAKAFEEFGENSLMTSRIYQVVCQCAAREDINFLLEKIENWSIQQTIWLSEIIIGSPILCKKLAEKLYKKIQGQEIVDLRAKTLIKLAYRLFLPFEMGGIDLEKSEATIDLGKNPLAFMLAKNKIKGKNIETIYVFNAKNNIKRIKKLFALASVAVVLIGADFDLFKQMSKEFSKLTYRNFSHLDKQVIYVVK